MALKTLQNDQLVVNWSLPQIDDASDEGSTARPPAAPAGKSRRGAGRGGSGRTRMRTTPSRTTWRRSDSAPRKMTLSLTPRRKAGRARRAAGAALAARCAPSTS